MLKRKKKSVEVAPPREKLPLPGSLKLLEPHRERAIKKKEALHAKANRSQVKKDAKRAQRRELQRRAVEADLRLVIEKCIAQLHKNYKKGKQPSASLPTRAYQMIYGFYDSDLTNVIAKVKADYASKLTWDVSARAHWSYQHSKRKYIQVTVTPRQFR